MGTKYKYLSEKEKIRTLKKVIREMRAEALKEYNEASGDDEDKSMAGYYYDAYDRVLILINQIEKEYL